MRTASPICGFFFRDPTSPPQTPDPSVTHSHNDQSHTWNNCSHRFVMFIHLSLVSISPSKKPHVCCVFPGATPVSWMGGRCVRHLHERYPSSVIHQVGMSIATQERDSPNRLTYTPSLFSPKWTNAQILRTVLHMYCRFLKHQGNS